MQGFFYRLLFIAFLWDILSAVLLASAVPFSAVFKPIFFSVLDG
jgi:hypothetical protein